MYRSSVIEWCNGKVVKVTPEGGVEVQLKNPETGAQVIWKFDARGVEHEVAFYLDDMPFEERKAELLEAEAERNMSFWTNSF
jgi:hypothetical protein